MESENKPDRDAGEEEERIPRERAGPVERGGG